MLAFCLEYSIRAIPRVVVIEKRNLSSKKVGIPVILYFEVGLEVVASNF
jgi:hypothetical protein